MLYVKVNKWPGGKEKELGHILHNLPTGFSGYFEPFVGGGSVYASIQADKYFINDKSEELFSLYSNISTRNGIFFDALEEISHSWDNMRESVEQSQELLTLFLSHRKGEIDDKAVAAGVESWLAHHIEGLKDKLPASLAWEPEVFHEELRKNLVRKLLRMRKIEKEKHELPEDDIRDNVATALLSSLYMYFRQMYNDRSISAQNPDLHSALFVFIRNYAYSGMFRYNAKGEFNVPYGGIAYNTKSLAPKLAYYLSDELSDLCSKTTIENLDFEEFLRKHSPTEKDFVFLDPPYDTEFSTYARNDFAKEDHKRLADYLCRECKAQWMMIIKKTDFIMSLYHGSGLQISSFDKKYQVSFMNRNDRNVQHLMITNYIPAEPNAQCAEMSVAPPMLPGFA